MRSIGSTLRLALPLALVLGAATVPARAGDEPVKTNDGAGMEVYRQGDKFVVALTRADGSMVLSLVEASNLKPDDADASRPDLADLIKKGRVTYTVRIAPNDAGTADDALPATDPHDIARATASRSKRKFAAALAPKRRSELAKQMLASVRAVTAIGQGLSRNSKDAGEPPPSPNTTATTPSSDAAR